MNKLIVGVAVAASMLVTGCGDPVRDYPQGQVVDQVAQQGGSIVEQHPYLTAGAAAAGAYYLGKRGERRRMDRYSGGYYRPATRVIHRTRYVQPRSYSSYSRPAYRTVTRTTTYRRR